MLKERCWEEILAKKYVEDLHEIDTGGRDERDVLERDAEADRC